MESASFLIWFFLITLLYFGLFVIPAFRLKKAIHQMIQLFRNQDSSCFLGVKSIDDLGLRPPGLIDGVFRSRDFRPYALQVLIQEKVVEFASDEKMCLKEEKVQEFIDKYRL